jgi:hypothetical protein
MPGKKDVESWWKDLADPDPARAYGALWRLTEVPDKSVALLRKRLTPASRPDVQAIRGTIEELDNDRFEVRENARKQLEKLGRSAVPAMRQALAKKPSLEVRRRLERLLELAEEQPLASEELRAVRAIVLLERIGSKESRALLASLAKGDAHHLLTREATMALERLSRLASGR